MFLIRDEEVKEGTQSKIMATSRCSAVYVRAARAWWLIDEVNGKCW